jgi:hypothetical protein
MNRWIYSKGALSLLVILWLAAGGSAAPGNMPRQGQSDAQNPYVYSPAKINFGQQLVDTQTRPRVALLQNKSNKPRNFLVFDVEGQNPGDFKVTNDCGSFLAPGTSCAVQVVFLPKDTGARVAAVKVTDNLGLSQTLSVTGFGTVPPPPPPPPGQNEPPPPSR